MSSLQGRSQVNLALTATAAHSGGGQTSAGYGPENYNDNVIATYTSCSVSGGTPWGWVTGPSTTNWIEYTWTTAQTITKVVFYKGDRPASSCTIQWWDGAAYQTAAAYNSTVCPADSITFTAVTTTKLRFYGIQGASNPNHREIQVYGVSCTGTPNAPTITTAAQTAPICPNTTASIAATNTGAPTGVQYQWEQSSSASGPWASVTGGSGGTTLSYTTASLSASTYFRVKVTCGTNTAASAAYYVQVGLSQPAAITGSATFCVGGSQTYSVPAVPGATSYTWTFPTGWTGGGNTNSVSVTPSSTGGNITVTATSSCSSSPVQTLAVTPGTLPAQPGTIGGNSIVCAGTSQPYSVVPQAGITAYNWTLPSGWTGTSTAANITAAVGSTGGTISVTATNGCGTSTPATLSVSMTTTPVTLGNITGNTLVCGNASQTYSVTPVQSVLYYTWTAPSGWTGTSNSPTLTTTTGTTGGNIQVTAFNGCGTSAPKTLAVAISPVVTPSVTASTPLTTICNASQITFTAAGSNGGTTPAYQWRVNGLAVGINANTYTSSTLANNDVVTVVMTSSALCPSSPTATSNALTMTVIPNTVPGINVNTSSPLDICSGMGMNFTSNITGGGSSPVYQWKKNGVNVGTNSPSYSSGPLNNADTVYCVLTTNATCPSQPSVSSNKTIARVAQTVMPSVNVTVYPGAVATQGQQLTFTATPSNGGSQPEYQWYKNGVPLYNEVGSTYVTNSFQTGDQVYARMVSNAACANPVIVNSNKVIMQNAVSVTGINSDQAQLILAPNPNNGQFVISARFEHMPAGKTAKLEVMNTVGQLVYTADHTPANSGEWSYTINLKDNTPSGIYILRIVMDQQMVIKRFEVNR